MHNGVTMGLGGLTLRRAGSILSVESNQNVELSGSKDRMHNIKMQM